MRIGTPLKDSSRESRLFRSRALVAAVITLLLVGVILVRLIYLQVFNHAHYTTLSRNNRVDIQPIAPTRGLIYDRNGVLLAQNRPAYSLEIIPERVQEMDTTLDEVAALIAVTEEDRVRFHGFLQHKRRFDAIPLRFRLNDEEVARIAANRHRLPGVEIRAHLARHYPLGALTAHSVGYVGRINARELQRLEEGSNYSATSHIGKVGVEKAFEKTLHGRVGFQQVETNARGRVLRVLERTPPVPGKNLHLTLDARLQRAAEEAFAGERGALVAIDPNDGAVLALVSTPAFDPNLFVNGISSEAYRALTGSFDRPLFNRALRGQYPPGSTAKPFIGLAGLAEGEITPNEKVQCPGWYRLKGDDRRYRDWKRRGHGPMDLEHAIVESCDVYFYDLAFNLGIDRISAFLARFGFGQATGLDIGGEMPGLLPSRDWKRRAHQQPWFPGETLITGIGQGFFLTTPLQLATTTAALAARGKRMRPRVVQAVEDPASGEREPHHLPALEPVTLDNPDHWEEIHDAMVEVIHGIKGTARGIRPGLTYPVAGKTGTAQVFGLAEEEEYVAEDLVKRLRDHALFISYAPADAPRIAVAVVVENGGSGGAVAAPIARRVMDTYLLSGTGEQP